MDPHVRGYVANAYTLTDTEALLNENRKDGYNSKAVKWQSSHVYPATDSSTACSSVFKREEQIKHLNEN